MKRYFIYSINYKNGSACGHIITDDCYPAKSNLMLYHQIPSNYPHGCVITEVKSIKDICDYFESSKQDEINYPLKRESKEEMCGGNGD